MPQAAIPDREDKRQEEVPGCVKTTLPLSAAAVVWSGEMSSLEMSVKNPCKETTTTLRCRNHVGCMFCPLLLFGSFSKSEK